MPEPRIKILPPEVVERIAAGEVIERPASAVKELLENSLDAGATRVTVETQAGGKTLLRVADDGCGMTPEEARIALERHATSKLRAADDLFAIHTLGFRGEALPSIAAIGKLEILTRPPDAAEGTRLRVEGGELLACEAAPAPVGTTVTVRELFYNVPARREFLRSDSAESARVAEVVRRLALAAHRTRLRLVQDGKETFLSPGAEERLNAVVAVLGRPVAKDLLRLPEPGEGPLRVSGFLARPTRTAKTRSQQHLYVNGRAVRSPLFYKALDGATRASTPAGRHVPAVVFLELPPDAVDVNVHPSKLEVRFQDEGAVHAALLRALKAALAAEREDGENEGRRDGENEGRRDGERERGSVSAPRPGTAYPRPPEAPPVANDAPPATAYPFAEEAIVRPGSPGTTGDTGSWGRRRDGETERRRDGETGRRGDGETGRRGEADHAPAEERETSDEKRATPEAGPDAVGTVPGVGAGETPAVPGSDHPNTRTPEHPNTRTPEHRAPSPTPPPGPGSLARLRLLGQAKELFLLAEAEGEFWIIDQHVAHERALFDRLMARPEAPEPPQPLLLPATLEVDPAAALALEEHAEPLRALGFAVEAFGPGRYRVTGVPGALVGRNYEQALRDLVDQLAETWEDGRPPLTREQLAAAAAGRACKAAVKAGQQLSAAEAEQLLVELRRSANPYTCPHGRPVFLAYSRAEVQALFGGDCEPTE